MTSTLTPTAATVLADRPRPATTAPPRSAVREAVVFVALTSVVVIALALALPGTTENPGPVSLLTLITPAIMVGVIRLTARLRGGPANPLPLGLRRAGFRSWTPAIGLPVIAIGGSFAAADAIGVVSFDGLLDYVVQAPSSVVIMTLLLLGEEIGWRSYLLPRIATVLSARRAVLLTGLIQGLFHVPLLVLTVAYDADGSRWVVVPGVVAVVTLGGVLFGWLRLHSHSLWPVAIAHAVVNTCLVEAPVLVSRDANVAAYLTGEGGLFTLLAVGLLAAALLRFADWSELRAGAWTTGR